MAIEKEILSEYKEQYEKALNFVNEESKNDPPTEPFRSHYTARDILIQLRKILKDAIVSVQSDEASAVGDNDNENEIIYKSMMAFVCRDLGRIFIFTEEKPDGETFLKECVDLVRDYKLRPEAVIPYIGGLNELSIIYGNREDSQKAYEYLIEAENTYKQFIDSQKNALALTDIFGGNADEAERDKGMLELENLYTLCTFYFAQVYGVMGEFEKSAYNCHLTLRRQIKYKKYEHIDFALNAATLSQYYIGVNKFKEARHLLAAATLILAEYEVEMLKPEMTEEEKAQITEQFKHRYADVARCWAKYGLALLAASKERLLADDENKVINDIENMKVTNDDYRFKELNLSTYEDRISVDYCLTFDDAKLVFHFVIKWLDEAKTYYKSDTDATEYSKIIKDFAELYQNIAFFEENPVNQAKMHKRRAKYFEELLALLNQAYFLDICRECWYGAGLAHCSILDIKLDALKETNTPAVQNIQKCNQICYQAIKHFQSFVNSYLEKDEKTIKPNIDDEQLRGVFYAYFHLGRLYFKIYSRDVNVQHENLSNSLKYYEIFIERCEKNKEASASLQAEVGVCKEMVQLLPIKIANMQKSLEK